MSSTCFEPENPSSGRELYIQFWYDKLYMHRYKQSSPEDEPSGSKHVEDIKTKN